MSPAAGAIDRARPAPAAGPEGRAEAPPGSARLEQVYEQWADYVWRMLQRLGVRQADLEDVCHDVFLVAHRRFSEFDGRVGVNAWLFGICLRLAANYRRRSRHRRDHSSAALDDASGLRAPTALEPDQQLLRRQAEARVQVVLGGMDLTKRAVFLMYEIEGLSCLQVAEQLGVPVGTVYSRLHAARRYFEQEAQRLSAEPRKDEP